MDIVVDYAFEIIAILIAAAALISAERAIRISRHALLLTKGSNLVALRLRANEAISDAERSFINLQTECQKTRDQWESHHAKLHPPMSLGIFKKPKEIQNVWSIERSGSALLRQLAEESPTQEVEDEARLERFIGLAKATTLQIERLQVQLEFPRPFSR
ncbi:MAG: hypothetical protein HC783_15100 [Rhodobacteraceae bacterium]|nr:hypothetical protein [Paracoccaceae bacterium]